MRLRHKYIIAPLVCMAMPMVAFAQKVFVEGTIVYSIQMQALATDGNSDIGVHKGYYTITIKGKQVKKEFKLDNDFDNTILLNGDANTAYSLKVSGDKKFAIQLDADELANRSSAYVGFRMEDLKGDAIVAGMQAQKAKVSYKDGSSVDILYTKEWKPADNYLLEHFPSANYLPLDFTYKTENGVQIHFHAEKVEPGVVENAAFRVPKDYKVITKSEYAQLSKQ